MLSFLRKPYHPRYFLFKLAFVLQKETSITGLFKGIKKAAIWLPLKSKC
jgi:hypothetical protein